MKNTYFMWLLLVAMSLSIGSCGEKKARDAGGTNSLSEVNASTTQPVISGRSLQQVFSEAKEGAVKRENATSTKDQPFRYQVLDSSIKRGDIDGDGDSDAIILVTTCEKLGCHPTTNVSEVEIVKNNSEKYEVIKRFSVGSSPTVDSIRGGRVMISAMQYGDDDPHCCPSEKHRYTVTIAQDGRAVVSEGKSTKSSSQEPLAGNDLPSDAFVLQRVSATDLGEVSVDHCNLKDARGVSVLLSGIGEDSERSAVIQVGGKVIRLGISGSPNHLKSSDQSFDVVVDYPQSAVRQTGEDQINFAAVMTVKAPQGVLRLPVKASCYAADFDAAWAGVAQ